MSTAQEIAADLADRLPGLQRGSLGVWGDVFGGRVDDVHTIVSVRAVDTCLVLGFDGGETLEVWEPDGVVADASRFVIRDAARVRWRWFSYGREQTEDNRYSIEHRRVGDVVTVSTDVTWAPLRFSPSTRHPAVELLGY